MLVRVKLNSLIQRLQRGMAPGGVASWISPEEPTASSGTLLLLVMLFVQAKLEAALESNAYDASMVVWKGAGDKTVPLRLYDV